MTVIHTLRSSLVLLALALPAAAQLPQSFFCVHTEPPNANPQNYLGLKDMVAAADARAVKLTIELSPPWVEMILASPSKQAQVLGWRANGHELGAHHHGVEAPGVWDGYTDLDPALVPAGLGTYLGTMKDYVALYEPLLGAGGLQTGAIPSHDWEWPYGIRHKTEGHSAAQHAVSQPAFEVRNRYGVWALTYGLLNTFPSKVKFQGLHAAAGPDDVVGAVAHAVNYAQSPGPIDSWFDYLESVDPTGARNHTVSEILGSLPSALQASADAIGAATGGTVDLPIRTGAELGGKIYLVLASLSGSDPGYDLGGVYDDGVHIGLVPDLLTGIALEQASGAVFQDFLGVLTAGGAADPAFVAPPLSPGVVGETLTFAAVAFEASGELAFSSNPVDVSIQ